jgi:hypothetical protein
VDGIETTTNLIAKGMALVVTTPDVARRLAAEPRLSLEPSRSSQA